MNTMQQIMRELYVALERIKAPIDLLAAVGSYNDTMTDEQILELLMAYNEEHMG